MHFSNSPPANPEQYLIFRVAAADDDDRKELHAHQKRKPEFLKKLIFWLQGNFHVSVLILAPLTPDEEYKFTILSRESDYNGHLESQHLL